MTLSTNMISGLASGFDWRTMVDQIIGIDHRRVDLVERTKSGYESQLSEWQSFNTKLLTLKTSSEKLKDSEDFQVYTAGMSTDSATYDADDLLSVTTGSSATRGTYAIKVKNLATAEKLSSNPFTSKTTELGSAYAGDMVINGAAITVNATDTLADVASTINNANSGLDPVGVTASVVSYGDNDFRLILTSEETGADGISLLNGSSTNLVQKFGWKDKQAAMVKNGITEGAQSDGFSAQNVVIQSLLGLSTGEASTGSLTIDGTSVTLDLSTMSLAGIKTAINDAGISGVTASVISDTDGDDTVYRLQIEGTQSFVDENNILNTLGVLHNNSNDIAAVDAEISANEMTSDGKAITADTRLVDIDGYLTHTPGDKITMTGNATGGGAVSYDFTITSATTVDDLLSAIETQYATAPGDAIAYLTSDGKIRVDDVAAGGSLEVTLASVLGDDPDSRLNFGTFEDAGSVRKRQIISGADATVEIDGVDIDRSSNTIDDVIDGVTLNLVSAESNTTITLNIDHDTDTIKSNISEFVTAYNSVMSYVNAQFSYDEEEEETGGVLFGDGTLLSVKSDLISRLTDSIWGVDSNYSTLGLIGVTLDNDLILSVDDAALSGYLETNFNDVMSLFVGQGTVSASELSYIGHGRESEAGEYTVHIDQAATRGAETGSVNLSGGGADETLTITQGNNTAAIYITSGMSLEDIKNEINDELANSYAQTLVGDQQLQAGGSAITASTAWADITGSTLQDGDVITFSGTDRAGGAVSGSYTIGSVGTDTVQGFLSAIEDEFSSDAGASIDADGRFVLTDKTTGSSRLSIEITEPAGKGLDFGTVDVTSGAGDGSREGRYTLSITADDDGSGHLVLRNDDYGSGEFTISQDTSDTSYDHVIHTATGNTTLSSGGAVYLTEATAWSDIYGADLEENDEIAIGGLARNGSTAISATYSIDSLGDTVSELMSAIEAEYAAHGTTVDAFIRDGKIYIEDTDDVLNHGASSIALTLTPNYAGGGSGLDLGTFDQTTERDQDLGLINGTVTGRDVAGTINGESAAGSGQVLTGDDGNVGTDGLSVRYSGTTDNIDAGSVTLTRGVADLFEKILYNITDTVGDGYVAFKQDSLQNRVDGLETQITDMEARLDQKMETMISRFIRMELTLSTLQNQSNWLTGQLSAAASGWK